MVDTAHRDDARHQEHERKERRAADRPQPIVSRSSDTDRRRLACMGWGIADALWGDDEDEL